MKLIKYSIILLLGFVIGIFVGSVLSTSLPSKEVCEEFKQVDWYEGKIRYTYMPELNKCYKR